MMGPSQEKTKPRFSSALLVAAGIMLSRIAGLVRQRIFAHYFGNSDAGDAFYAALKIPNFLQNLFGEGVLSASFIPVYAGLLGENDEKAAQKVAHVIFSVLALVTSAAVLLGVLFTPALIDLIAPGFHGEKRLLTILLVRIFFPGTGLLVMSAWCLGILNSHRRFFLSYASPVLWNGAIIGCLLYYGRHESQEQLAVYTSWGLVGGSALQFFVQIPTALKLLGAIRLNFDFRFKPVLQVFRSFVPVVVARGVVQISAYIDNLLASLLATGAVSSLAYAQALYMLPVSLFGMSVSASELPEMARERGAHADVGPYLQKRLNQGLRKIAFFIVPSVAGFWAMGDVVVSALYQTGEFNSATTQYVWLVLAGSAIGLLATTMGRLYSSAFYSLQDTKTPLKFALVRVFLTTLLGVLFGLKIPAIFGLSSEWGAAGLTASAGISGWFEFIFLQRSLNKRIGHTGLPWKLFFQLWACALIATALTWPLKSLLIQFHPMARAAVILPLFAVIYFAVGAGLKITEANNFVARILRAR